MAKWSLIGAWVLVVVLATTLTWQIVSAADEQVSDRPVAALQVEAPLVAATDSTTTSQTNATVTGSPGSSTPLGQPGSSSTTSTAPPGTSTSTTSNTAPPTTAAATWKSQTVSTDGGVVVVSYRTGEVRLSSATPSPGFAADVKNSGPSEVEVEFESESSKFEVKARWSEGELKVETDSEDEED